MEGPALFFAIPLPQAPLIFVISAAFFWSSVNSGAGACGALYESAGILSGIEGLTNTQFTGTEMYELYSDLKNKQAAGTLPSHYCCLRRSKIFPIHLVLRVLR